MLVKKRTGIPVLPNVFDEFISGWPLTNFSETNTTLPAINILENDNEFKVEVAVPGMNKDDFHICYKYSGKR